MRRVEPVSLTAAGSVSAVSLVGSTAGMATGVGSSSAGAGGGSSAAAGGGSAEGVQDCKLAGAGVMGARVDVGSLSPAEDSGAFCVTSGVGSGVGEGGDLGEASAAESEEALHTASGTVTTAMGEGKTGGVFARDCFGGMDGGVRGAGVFGVSSGVSALPVVASVSCRSLITSRSLPLLLSALPVLPAPESTSSWAKLSMLSRILNKSAPSSSSPTKASLFSAC